MGSMQFELWNMILINHGCEQQIKNDEILSKKKKSLGIPRIFFVHKPFAGNEKNAIKEQREHPNTHTAFLGPRGRQTHKEPNRTKCKVWLYEYRA